MTRMPSSLPLSPIFASAHTAHLDTFTRDNLPAPEALPEFVYEGPDLQFPDHLNCATELLDRPVVQGWGDRLCVQGLVQQQAVRWTYADLQAQANRIAHVLVQEMGLLPGNRVLLRGANSPMLAACFMAIFKAGGVAVGSMPLLRAGELAAIIDKAQISHALCDAALSQELSLALPQSPSLRQVLHYGGELEARASKQSAVFENVDTGALDTCVIAFTSGTTGVPKGTMHFHRDLMAACRCWPPHVLRAQPDDVFIGSPPLAFTFGLGGLLLFPMSIGASTVLIEKAAPDALLQAITQYRASVCFTAPTSYRAMALQVQGWQGRPGQPGPDLGSLRKCVSAGEALPAATRQLWKASTGIEIIDGIGSTEMLHIFISADEAHAKPGATGLPVPGYQATVLDDDGQPVPRGQVGRLAVKGPTGCKYLADARQSTYVQGGWNLTGDAYLVDEDGQYVYQARTDDMIISGGYNIAGPEVEGALLLHPAVAECGVVGQMDEARGMIVKAFVVLKPGHPADADMAKALQDFVKQTIAPYKYPREIAFATALPRTETGKLQRFRLKSGV